MPIYVKFRTTTLNKSEKESILDIRDVENITIYQNHVFSKRFLDEEIPVNEHVWKHGDKLYKLAATYYGDKSLFWIIGLFNNKPSDAHYSYGDIVYVPVNYEAIYQSAVE